MKVTINSIKYTILILTTFAIFSCNNGKKESQINIDKQAEFEVEYLEGYFPKNDMEFSAPIRALVITNQENFDKYFGVAQTMKNQVPRIDFDKNKVVAVISAPSDKKQKVVISSLDLKNNKLLVKYKVKDEGETQSFTSTDLKMFLIPKSVYGVDFIVDQD